jgi:hypothetical protein
MLYDGKDPDPNKTMTDPALGGPKTYGSYGFPQHCLPVSHPAWTAKLP